jgi:phage regulator Rha-like protein
MSKKNQEEGTAIIPSERIESKIYLIRGKKVMLDRDLAALYEVETRQLNQAVKRNLDRFPPEFMFQLTKEEMENWKSQIVISNRERMGLRKPPLAFTDYGVLMLSSVLNSDRAIQVNIQIIKTFTRLRELVATNKEILEKIERMEKKYDEQFRVVFEAIRRLLTTPEEPPKRRIGFSME